VIGHTDRVGSVEHNDALSKKRAELVSGALTSAGIPAAQIEVAGRGEREPVVATADEVAEPRNRRVEISIR
jgi:outer membrane protein OmpA-like peptidoglycan-associated protein